MKIRNLLSHHHISLQISVQQPKCAIYTGTSVFKMCKLDHVPSMCTEKPDPHWPLMYREEKA